MVELLQQSGQNPTLEVIQLIDPKNGKFMDMWRELYPAFQFKNIKHEHCM